jgi:tetratricopeptide (TPR) repeat protein
MPYLSKEDFCTGITELEIYSTISKDCTLDIEQLKTIKKIQFVDFSAEAPEITHFYGRKREMALLKKRIEDKEGPNIIFIHGIAGIGKTTLAAKLTQNYLGSKHLFWHNFHELDALPSVLLKLGEFLSEVGLNHLEVQLRAQRSFDHLKISGILRQSIGTIDGILIFDDFQKANDQIKQFFAYFVRILTPPSKTKMVIMSREIIPFYDQRDVLVRKLVTELELEGLDFESSKRLLKGKGIDKKKFKEIHDFTAGNPLYLEVFESKDRVERYLSETFLNLGEDEKKILGMISIHRFPIPEDTLAVNSDFDFRELYALMQKSIVKKDTQDRYLVHDIIKQFFYRRLSPSKRKERHLLAARWYENSDEPSDLIEAIHHYQQAEEFELASRFAVDSSISVFNSGYSAEYLTTLEKFDEKDLESSEWAEILIVKGKACNMCGEWKKALHYLTQGVDAATMTDNIKLKARALCESGHILEEQNELEKAMEHFKKCRKISDNTDYPLGTGEGYRGMGRVHWRRSKHGEAIANFEKCLEISKRSEDLELTASIYIDLGNVYDEKYEMEKAIECYKKSLDILKTIKNASETTRAFINLAATYKHFEKFNESFHNYTISIDLAEDIRDIKYLTYSYAGISYCLAKVDKFEKARGYVKKAEDIALKIDNENVMFDIYRTHAYIYKHETKWEEALEYFRKSIAIVEKLKASYYLSDAHLEFGQLFYEKGDTKNAKKHFDIAARLYTELGLEKVDIVRDKLSKYNDYIG